MFEEAIKMEPEELIVKGIVCENECGEMVISSERGEIIYPYREIQVIGLAEYSANTAYFNPRLNEIHVSGDVYDILRQYGQWSLTNY
ncbi:MAG TPA: hypothetical protein PKU93_03250 [Candidatus Pacearchaeota archaeon]|nr:hypothetical protein [Candidatus Pacearchaeota archaeon]